MACDVHSTSRRALLSGLVATSILSGRAIAAALGPDAELLALGERWTETRTAYLRVSEKLDDLTDANPRLPAPEAIFFRDADHDFCFHRHTCQRADDLRWYFVGPPGPQHPNVPGPALRQPIKRPGVFPPPYGHPLHGKASLVNGLTVWPEAQARADEIVSAFDDWRAAIEMQEVANGIAAARAELARLGKALTEIEQSIEAATATTLSGLRVKARLLQCDTRRDIEPSETLLRGLIADLLATGGQA